MDGYRCLLAVTIHDAASVMIALLKTFKSGVSVVTIKFIINVHNMTLNVFVCTCALSWRNETFHDSSKAAH